MAPLPDATSGHIQGRSGLCGVAMVFELPICCAQYRFLSSITALRQAVFADSLERLATALTCTRQTILEVEILAGRVLISTDGLEMPMRHGVLGKLLHILQNRLAH